MCTPEVEESQLSFFFPASLTATFFSGACMLFRGAVNVAICWVLHAPNMIKCMSSSTRKSMKISHSWALSSQLCENHCPTSSKPSDQMQPSRHALQEASVFGSPEAADEIPVSRLNFRAGFQVS